MSLRFWEVEKTEEVVYEAIDQLDEVTSKVVPEFAATNATLPELAELDATNGDDAKDEEYIGEEVADQPPEEGLKATVVEMATRLPADESPIQLAFRRCLGCLEDVSRGYAVGARSMVAPLRAADIHPLVLFIPRVGGREGNWRHGFSIYTIPSNFDPEYLTREWEHADQGRVLSVLFRLREGDPVVLYGEQILIAKAEHTAGDFGSAVVAAAIAAEILLDALLGLMLWEERLTEADAAEAIRKTVADRLRSEYHSRLGGNWDQTGEQEVGTWRRELANMRNRVVHRGYRPTEAEADAAVNAAVVLEEFVGELVVARRYTYWRTALIFVGTSGLERRSLWNKRMQGVLSDSGEDPDVWYREYRDWRSRIDAQL